MPEHQPDPQVVEIFSKYRKTHNESVFDAYTADIRRCLTQGRRRRFGYLEMIWTDNLTGHPRMGLIVPKHQSSAVARNRLRRRLREIWRREVQQHQPAWDLVIRARREAYAATFEALRKDVLAWRGAVLESG